jgi:hypothetical protein
MKAKTVEGLKKMTVKETLLGLGMIVVTAGTTAIMAGQYLHGLICVSVGFGVLFFRGYVKNGFKK